jgi:type VI secretion system protein ImpM
MDASGVGFFGKLPTLGDFISRRLPRQFIDPWDQWLQSSMRASQEIHGDGWLSLFLVSPFWRFAISPGICGETAWAGVIMPSVDRVGRYYPLTLAQVIDAEQVTAVFLPESAWFEQLESAALSVLDEPFELEIFEQSLLNIRAPSRLQLQNAGIHSDCSANAKTAFRCALPSLSQTGQLFPDLAQNLLDRFLKGYSFWATEGGQQDSAQFFCFEGMPPVDAYAHFLQSTPHSAAAVVSTYPALKPLLDPQEGNEPTIPKEEPLAVACVNGQWQSHGITEVGNRRKHNEDAMLNAPELGLWVVADGMGGHQSGDVASQRVVSGLAVMPGDIGLSQQVEWACSCLQQINADLCQIASQLQPGAVIGSTLVGLLAKGDECAAIWAGDSRLYRLRHGQFEQLTQDHTLLDELVTVGGMKREDAMHQVGANVITRAVGGQPTLELDVIRFQAESGDRYVLCSDGLDKELAETEIAEGVAIADCRQAAESLINTALSRNAIDNITVIVIEYLKS